MDELQQLRDKIDSIDRQMAALFEQRMHCVNRISRVKVRLGLPVRDPEREAAMAENGLRYISDETLHPLYARFLSGLTSLSREYQETLRDRSGEPFPKPE